MFGLGYADIFVILLYLGGITVLGTLMARRIKNMIDFFMGGRNFGKPMMIMFSFGTGTHSDQAVSVASKSFTNGLSGIWYQWLWLFCTPFYWLIAPVFRRMRALTTGDYFEKRFDRSVSGLFASIGLFSNAVNIGVMLKGSAAVISAATLGQVHPNVIMLVATVLFVIYGIAGGLAAAIVTDFIQGIMTIVFSFMILPFALNFVGGMTGLRETITNSELFRLIEPGEIGLFYIIVITLNALVGIVTQPHTMGNCAAGRSEMDGRVGFTFGVFIKRICTIAWCLTGFAGIAIFAGQTVDPDHVFGLLAQKFLSTVVPGFMGLFIATLLASVMSSCDAFMNASSGLFVENFYRPHIKPGMSQKHYVFVGRFASLFVVLGGVIFALWLPSVVKGLEIFWRITPMLGIAFYLGLFWRRTTVAGAWASTLSAFFTWWLTSQAFVIEFLQKLPFSESLRLVFVKVYDGVAVPEVYLPWQMVMYLTVGLVVGIVVSLFTKRLPEEQLDNFYEVVRTPVQKGEKHPEEVFQLPEGMEPAPQNKLINHPDFEIQRPSGIAFAGFMGWCFMVVLLIAVFVWIVT